MQNKSSALKFTLLMTAATLAAGMAHAQQSIGDLSKIQSETLILKAKVQRATAQADLESKTKNSSFAQFNGDDVPLVQSVSGVGGKRMATFLYPSGSTHDAGVGDPIPGGYTVTAISITDVTATKGGKTVKVAFVPRNSSGAQRTNYGPNSSPMPNSGMNGMPLAR